MDWIFLNFLLPNLNLYDVEDYIQPNNTYGKIAYLKNNLNQVRFSLF